MGKKAFFLFIFLLIIPNLFPDKRGLDVVIKNLDSSQQVGKQWLVIIAISRYYEWPNLRYPTQDAREIKDILVRRYYIDEAIEIYDEEATKENIIKLFVNLQKDVGLNDSVLIYYAGHGHLDKKSNSSFWIPYNAGLDEFVQDNWLPHSQLKGLIKNIKSIHICLISDACFSGDILNITRAKPDTIDNEYFKKAYSRISRQVLTSGESEEVPDKSEFSYLLKLALEKNTSPYLDPLMLYNEIRLGIKYTTPLLGNLKDTGHQEGGSFLLFLQEQEETSIPEKTFGTVLLRLKTGGKLYIDNDFYGKVPIPTTVTINNIETGEHTIEMQYEGGAREIKNVYVNRNEKVYVDFYGTEPSNDSFMQSDLGVILYSQAPKTWTINVPDNFYKVEIAIYSKGKDEANKYGGWAAYLQINNNYVWKFVRFDKEIGGIIHDYILGRDVMEVSGRGQYLDITSMIKAGTNTITYYHFTEGPGLGVKYRIYIYTH